METCEAVVVVLQRVVVRDDDPVTPYAVQVERGSTYLGLRADSVLAPEARQGSAMQG